MSEKIINFNKEKAKLIKERYPNIKNAKKSPKVKPLFVESNKALDKFQSIFMKYQEYLVAPSKNKEVKLEEVLVYFNRYFDAIYSELTRFDSRKVPKFKEALDYAMISQGKRLRPFLMFVSYNFFLGQDVLLISPLMVAMEMIHTFSLVHDDLPCMDNDELRRGKPTVWKKYGEDIGTLVGDALMMEASSLLVEMIMELGYTDVGTFVTTSCLILLKLAGLDGMIVGQVFDVMNTKNKKLTIGDLIFMYEKKTTALIVASLVIGANMSTHIGKNISQMELLGAMLGEAYQIQDDLLEVEGTTKQIGKSVDSDKKNGKVTLVSKIGVADAKERLSELYTSCHEVIDKLTTKSNVKEAVVFNDVIDYIFDRKY